MNKLEILKEPLYNLASQIYKASGITLNFTYCKRDIRGFNPEDASDMIDIYPDYIFSLGFPNRKGIDETQWSAADAIMETIVKSRATELAVPKNTATIEVSKYDEDLEEYENMDLAEALQRDLEVFVNDYKISSLMVVIDELYIDTISDKIKAETIDSKLLQEKIYKEFIPQIVAYVSNFPKLCGRLSQIMKANRLMQSFSSTIDYANNRENVDTNSYGVINRWVNDYNKTPQESFRTSLIVLTIFEVINDAIKGDTKNIRILDEAVAYIIKNIINTHHTHKFLNVETVLRSALGKNQKGSSFDYLLSRIMRSVNSGFSETPASFGQMENFLSAVDKSRNRFSEIKTDRPSQILASKELLKYAESCDILAALQDKMARKEIRMYAESITFTEDEIEKEMMKVTDIAREASIAKIDMEYITTKYSKKDAINNAYIVLQEAQALRRKLKTKEAIEACNTVIKTLNKDIEETRKFDHKKSRMTINIAYPEGYEG